MSCILAKRNSVSGLKMADVGAGRSGLLFAFSRQGADIEAFDTDYRGNTLGSPDAEERFLFHANKVARASFGSIYNIPANSGQYDAVLCICVLEHLSHKRAAMDELKRLLKPGGTLVLVFAIADNPSPRPPAHESSLPSSDSEGPSLDPRSLADLLGGLGTGSEIFTAAQIHKSAQLVHDATIEGVPSGMTFGAVCLTRQGWPA